MERKIVLFKEGEEQIEVWGGLKELCRSHYELKYDYLKKLQFPIKSKGYILVRVPYRTKLI